MNKQHAYDIASRVLADRQSTPMKDLASLVGTTECDTIAGPDGQTYFVEVEFEALPQDSGIRITAIVDLGNSYKLERIEESIDIRTE